MKLIKLTNINPERFWDLTAAKVYRRVDNCVKTWIWPNTEEAFLDNKYLGKAIQFLKRVETRWYDKCLHHQNDPKEHHRLFHGEMLSALLMLTFSQTLSHALLYVTEILFVRLETYLNCVASWKVAGDVLLSTDKWAGFVLSGISSLICTCYLKTIEINFTSQQSWYSYPSCLSRHYQ